MTQTTSAPAPAIPPVPAEPTDETPGESPSVNPPENAHTPGALEAGPLADGITAEHQDPPAPDEPDPATPPEQRAYDPATPDPEAVVPTDQDPGGSGAAARERVLRNAPTPGLPHYAFGLNDADENYVVSDPVDLFTGTYGLMETDFELPGRRFPLLLRRRYRSGVPFFGPWGYGWDHNLNGHVRPLDDGYAAVWTGMINENVYRPLPDGSFEPPLGVVNRLAHILPGPGTQEAYVVSAPDGSTWRYARPSGWMQADRFPLTRFEDRFGNGHDYTYDPEGRLARVSDDLGQHLEFGYGACDLLEWVRDHSGRVVRYRHDSDRLHLIAVVRPATPEAPDGASLCFEYDVFERHGRLRHNITRVIDEIGRTRLLNVYGKDPGQADFARVVTQFYGGHRADFRYTRLSSPSRLANAVNLPAWRIETLVDGDYKLLTFNFRGNLLEERHRLVRDGSYRLFVTARRYDKRGNAMLVVLPNGMTRHLTYDVDNADPAAWSNLLQIDLQAPPSRPAPARRRARLHYEPRYQLPVSYEDESGALTRLHYDHQNDPAGRGALVSIEFPDATLPDGTVQAAVATFSANPHGQVLLQRSPEGRTVGYTYNDRGLLSAIERDPGGLALRTEVAYDDVGNAIRVNAGDGSVSLFEYDARNRLVRAVKPDVGGTAPEIRLSYHPTGKLAVHRRPAGDVPGGRAARSRPIIALTCSAGCASGSMRRAPQRPAGRSTPMTPGTGW